MSKKETGKKTATMILLQACFLISSLSGVCSKLAANQKVLSLQFIFWFGMVLFLMGVYAILWQQVLKRMPLTVAYASKPVSLLWGFLWGSFLFHEKITWTMLVSAGIIFWGIYLVVTSDEE